MLETRLNGGRPVPRSRTWSQIWDTSSSVSAEPAEVTSFFHFESGGRIAPAPGLTVRYVDPYHLNETSFDADIVVLAFFRNLTGQPIHKCKFGNEVNFNKDGPPSLTAQEMASDALRRLNGSRFAFVHLRRGDMTSVLGPATNLSRVVCGIEALRVRHVVVASNERDQEYMRHLKWLLKTHKFVAHLESELFNRSNSATNGPASLGEQPDNFLRFAALDAMARRAQVNIATCQFRLGTPKRGHAWMLSTCSSCASRFPSLPTCAGAPRQHCENFAHSYG